MLRRQFRFPVRVTHSVFVGTRLTKGLCTQIDEFGMRVEIPNHLSVGEIVDVVIPPDTFQAFARVTYRNQSHYGLYFVDLDPAQRKKLAGIIAKRNASDVTGGSEVLQ